MGGPWKIPIHAMSMINLNPLEWVFTVKRPAFLKGGFRFTPFFFEYCSCSGVLCVFFFIENHTHVVFVLGSTPIWGWTTTARSLLWVLISFAGDSPVTQMRYFPSKIPQHRNRKENYGIWHWWILIGSHMTHAWNLWFPVPDASTSS